MLDAINQLILQELQTNGRLTTAELGRRVEIHHDPIRLLDHIDPAPPDVDLQNAHLHEREEPPDRIDIDRDIDAIDDEVTYLVGQVRPDVTP